MTDQDLTLAITVDRTPEAVFAALNDVRFLDLVAEVRPDLHRYCARMTGSVFDRIADRGGEVQNSV